MPENLFLCFPILGRPNCLIAIDVKKRFCSRQMPLTENMNKTRVEHRLPQRKRASSRENFVVNKEREKNPTLNAVVSHVLFNALTFPRLHCYFHLSHSLPLAIISTTAAHRKQNTQQTRANTRKVEKSVESLCGSRCLALCGELCHTVYRRDFEPNWTCFEQNGARTMPLVVISHF